MKTTQSFEDVMVLGQGHSILLNSTPSNLPLEKVIDAYEKGSSLKESRSSFGLFGSGINYNTYYPEVDEKHLQPEESEFIEPVFRLLSACIVSKNYYPTDFSEPGVLKNSMNLILGQSVHCDHDTEVGNAIGVVSQVVWQESFTQEGVVVPAGINGVLKIDGKSNPRLARGIMMNPPSIHSNSVTVVFKWKPSHDFEKAWEFWDNLGKIHEDGTMVRRIVTEIINYNETSLVHHGADPFAQKIEDGKLNHIAHAAKSYYSSMENSQKLQDDYLHRVFTGVNYKTSLSTSLGGQSTLQNSTLIQNEKQTEPITNMETIILNVADIINDDMLQLGGETPTPELVIASIKAILKENQTNASLKSDVQSLTEEKEKLNEKIKTLTTQAEYGLNHVKQVRDEVLASYNKLMGDQTDEAIISLLSNENTDVKTLQALGKTYQMQLDSKYPLTCSKCGSDQVNRGSSVQDEDPDDSNSENEDSVSNSIDKLVGIAHR